ncbi:extracellular solute-binding protein [Caulobacter sp. SSI4214]|uniref:ABC transporter substrate-binding protein n=1 Tax=Caulobacter sp. SSI4214 TaxID=2575739 RepID=UPI0014395E6E|nr:extracellular solute-binding protein [Caulobacter sp. SSI4214]
MAALVLAATLVGCAPKPAGQATSAWDVNAAQREGELVIYMNSDGHEDVTDGFQRRFPKIKVRLVTLTSVKIRERLIAETQAGKPVADVAWSSTMDIQVKLINDGYAQTYRSPEAKGLPTWAVWRDQGFGVTAEPIVFAYNKKLLNEAEVPRSHAALLAALRADPDRWRGKIAMYDPERSGLGFMYMSGDLQVYPDAQAMYDALAGSEPGLFVVGSAMLNSLTDQHVMVFGLTQTFAEWWARRRNPDLGYVVPNDYQLLISRVAFITRSAPHPKAARLFLDYLMSDEGQRRLAQSGLPPIRSVGGATALGLGARPIRIGPALLANFDQGRRAELLDTWRAALKQ